MMSFRHSWAPDHRAVDLPTPPEHCSKRAFSRGSSNGSRLIATGNEFSARSPTWARPVRWAPNLATWTYGVILSNSQISIQQQQELRKANREVLVPTPCPDTLCIAVIPGFSQIHKLVFFMGLAKGPTPHDASLNQHQDCKVTHLFVTSKHCYKKEEKVTIWIWSKTDPGKATKLQENYHNKGTRPSPQKWAGGQEKSHDMTWLCLRTAENTTLPSRCKYIHLGKGRRDSMISFHSP